MNNYLLCLSFLFIALVSCKNGSSKQVSEQNDAESVVGVYVYDKDSYVNVRNAPSGKVISTIPRDSEIVVDKCVNGWFRIHDNQYACPERDLGGAITELDSEMWIHQSVVHADWANDGLIVETLYESPSDKSPIVYKGKEVDEDGWVHGLNSSIKAILDIKDGFVKIKLDNGVVGWTPKDRLCGSMVTVCC